MRAIWKGALSFGLVNIPVSLYTASKEKEISFILLHKKDNSKIRYARICEAEGKEVPWEEIVKGYEYEEGNFIVMKDEDFEKINLKKTKTIEIVHFIKEEEVDSVYYTKPYFLEPDKNSSKAYGLLREALKKTRKVGIARYVLRNREHLAVLRIYNDMLILNELRYQSEIVKPEDLNIPPQSKPPVQEVDIAIQLIDKLTVPFKPQEYKDTFTQEMKQLIKQKSKGRPVHPKTEELPSSTKVHDIMSLLKASLETKKTSSKKARKTA